MLGTRDPELLDPHASTGYLIWLDDKARIIIDTGPGTVQNFTKSSANYEDMLLMLFTHFNGKRSADFSAYTKGGFLGLTTLMSSDPVVPVLCYQRLSLSLALSVKTVFILV